MDNSIIETDAQTIQSEGATFLLRRQGSRRAPRFSTAVYRADIAVREKSFSESFKRLDDVEGMLRLANATGSARKTREFTEALESFFRAVNVDRPPLNPDLETNAITLDEMEEALHTIRELRRLLIDTMGEEFRQTEFVNTD